MEDELFSHLLLRFILFFFLSQFISRPLQEFFFAIGSNIHITHANCFLAGLKPSNYFDTRFGDVEDLCIFSQTLVIRVLCLFAVKAHRYKQWNNKRTSANTFETARLAAPSRGGSATETSILSESTALIPVRWAEELGFTEQATYRL